MFNAVPIFSRWTHLKPVFGESREIVEVVHVQLNCTWTELFPHLFLKCATCLFPEFFPGCHGNYPQSPNVTSSFLLGYFTFHFNTFRQIPSIHIFFSLKSSRFKVWLNRLYFMIYGRLFFYFKAFRLI